MIPIRYWREIVFAAVVIPLAFGFWLRGERLDAAAQWQGEVIYALGTATKAEKPIAKKSVVATIKAMGEATDKLESAIADQNAAFNALKATATAKQKASQDALRAAEKRETALAGKIAGLERSASVRRSDGVVCEVSDAVAEVWQ